MLVDIFRTHFYVESVGLCFWKALHRRQIWVVCLICEYVQCLHLP